MTAILRVRSMSKDFASLSDEQLYMYIEDAQLEVSSLFVPKEQTERLVRYLAAHFASLNIRKVLKEKVDTLERTYSDVGNGGEGLNATPFGTEYQRILSGLLGTNRKKLNLTVL